MTKTKKTRSLFRAYGVSCIDGKTYRIHGTGRNSKLEMFQVAVPGITEFRFVRLPKVMAKREAAEYLAGHINHQGMIEFLKGKIAAWDAETNKVPGKRGRPLGWRKVKTIVKETPVTKPVVAKIEALPESVKVANPISEAQRAKNKADTLSKIRAAALQS